MANNFGRVNVSISASTGGLTAGLNRAEKALNGFSRVAISPLSALGTVAKSTFGQLAMFSAAKGIIGGVMGMASSAVSSLSEAVQNATDLGEEASKSNVIFGKSAGQIAKFADSASAIGLSRQAALQATGTFGNLFTAMGLGSDRAAEYATKMTTLGADLASFSNTTVDEAITAIGAALRGESEPIRRYGVLLDDATLKQAALDAGLVTSTKGVLPPAIKAQAAYALILKQTSKAQGDFARTSDSLANLNRVVDAQKTNLSAIFGIAFQPAFQALASSISEAMKAAEPIIKGIASGMADAVQMISAGIRALVPRFQAFAAGLDGENIGQAIGKAIIQGAKYLAKVADLVINKFRELYFTIADTLGVATSKEAKRLSEMQAQINAGTAPQVAVAGGGGFVTELDPAFAREFSDLTNAVSAQRQELSPFASVIADAEKAIAALASAPKLPPVPPPAEAAPPPPKPAPKAVAQLVRISSQDLNAIVSGTSGAESFRNALARGADPRLDTKDEMRRAADAGERSADGIEELVRTGLIGVATIA